MSEPEFSPSVPREEPLSPKKKLETIGLSAEKLRGIRILDINAGHGTFANEKFGAKITDINPEREEELDVLLELPDGEFDFVTATEGPLRGDPADQRVISFYKESLRLIKDDGEVRIRDPFQGVESPGSAPEGWASEEELEYLLYNEGLDVRAKRVTTKQGAAYLSLKKLA